MTDQSPARAPAQRVAVTLQVLTSALEQAGLAFETTPSQDPVGTSVVVELPGRHKLKTPVSFSLGPHSVSINAFVVRAPDENAAAVHEWLLRRNRRLFVVSYAVDHLGDVYLVGRIPHEALTEETVDAILGAIVDTADGDFNTLLEMGFESAIRAEWRWRLDRGESTANLQAFGHLAPPDGEPPEPK